MSATTEERRVGRPRPIPDPTSREWHAKLGRLVERKRKGRTNAQIAIASGITPTFFGQVLSGKKSPNLTTLMAILDALSATLTDFDRA
jgi:hypothetical protein